jgi:hypothetical protein
MRFMVIIKGNAESEAGIFPKPEFMAAMGKYNRRHSLRRRSAGAKSVTG